MGKQQVKSKASNIDIASGNIVCEETAIRISDEKLKGFLMRAYENARKDARSFKYYKLYNVILSVAGTLFITLLTSDFKAIGGIKSSTLSTIAWIVLAILLVLGLVFASINSTKSNENETDKRDETVENLLREIKKD